MNRITVSRVGRARPRRKSPLLSESRWLFEAPMRLSTMSTTRVRRCREMRCGLVIFGVCDESWAAGAAGGDGVRRCGVVDAGGSGFGGGGAGRGVPVASARNRALTEHGEGLRTRSAGLVRVPRPARAGVVAGATGGRGPVCGVAAAAGDGAGG